MKWILIVYLRTLKGNSKKTIDLATSVALLSIIYSTESKLKSLGTIKRAFLLSVVINKLLIVIMTFNYVSSIGNL